MILTSFAACGGKKPDDKPAQNKSDGGSGSPNASPIAIPKSGIDRVERMNFQWGSPGSRDYLKAQAAYASKGKARDWVSIKSNCEAALAKDAQHLGAHWLLAAALSQLGEYPAAVDHVVSAMAADYYKYGVALATSEDLKPFLATPSGAAVTELAARIRDDYKAKVARAVFVVARRSSFRWPDKPSSHESSSRGELYAYDRDTRQYLRITHTNDTVVGYQRSAAGSEIAVLTYDRIDRATDKDAPTITRAHVQLFDTADFKPGAKATIDETAREIGLGYGPGDNLLITVAAASGRWGTAEPTVYSFDRATGKLTKNTVAPPVPRIAFTLEEGRLIRQPADVKAAWTPELTSPSLEVGGKAVSIPESGSVSQSTVAVAGKLVAFATAVDPCAKDSAPSLHVADLAKGRQQHLLTAKSHFETVWLDDTTLAYEDGEGQIRLWDATTMKQLPNPLVNRPGIALFVLSLSPGPLCKQAEVPVAGSGSGSNEGSDEPPLPPED